MDEPYVPRKESITNADVFTSLQRWFDALPQWEQDFALGWGEALSNSLRPPTPPEGEK